MQGSSLACVTQEVRQILGISESKQGSEGGLGRGILEVDGEFSHGLSSSIGESTKILVGEADDLGWHPGAVNTGVNHMIRHWGGYVTWG